MTAAIRSLLWAATALAYATTAADIHALDLEVGEEVGDGLAAPPHNSTMVDLDGEWAGTAYEATPDVETCARYGPDGCKNEAKVSMSGRVPGDITSDLQANGLIGDPLFEINFKNALWDQYVWVYSKHFPTPHLSSHNYHKSDVDTGPDPTMMDGSGRTALLTLHGVKMGAVVYLNGQFLGNVTDQFVRYTYSVLPWLKSDPGAQNVLTVSFNMIPTAGRFMACSGGWDWAPLSNTYNSHNEHTFSRGIYRSVSLRLFDSNQPIITDMVPTVHYNGYPTSPMLSGAENDFTVKVQVHTWCAVNTTADMVVTGAWGKSGSGLVVNMSRQVRIPAGEHVLSAHLTAKAGDVDLWWPRWDYMDSPPTQPLYDVTASISSGDEHHRRIGFRVVALVTGNDTNATYVEAAKTQEGSDGHGMLVRVNGGIIMARGSNVIPMDNFEGRMSDVAHARMVKSAAAAGHNMLRVWGGGMYLPQSFYDTADEIGVLIFHDQMFSTTTQTHVPSGSPEETLEIRQNVRALAHHPSIVVWNACNECGGGGLYTSFVMTTVADEDHSRPIWPSCPSSGFTAGVHKLTSLPNGNTLEWQSQSTGIEAHGPYLHGDGFAAVNSNHGDQVDPSIPLVMPATEPLSGPQHSNTFASEFGASVMSSFESMSATLAHDHWGLHGGTAPDDCVSTDRACSFWNECDGINAMSERNYPCDTTITAYFGEQDFDLVGEAHFKRQLYQCMISQALYMSSDISSRRAHNSFGLLTWQLNEIWPTGGWGSLEYGSVGWTSGQVLGGRWKPLHYLMARWLYKDIMIACGIKKAGDVTGTCYVVNDCIEAFNGTVELMPIHLDGTVSSSDDAEAKWTQPIVMRPGPGQRQWYTVPKSTWGLLASNKTILVSTIRSSTGKYMTEHVIMPTTPVDLHLTMDVSVTLEVSEHRLPDGAVPITVKASHAVALYVMLTTRAQGRFSDNAFHLIHGQDRVVTFVPFEGFEMHELKRSLRVEHLAQNLDHSNVHHSHDPQRPDIGADVHDVPHHRQYSIGTLSP